MQTSPVPNAAAAGGPDSSPEAPPPLPSPLEVYATPPEVLGPTRLFVDNEHPMDNSSGIPAVVSGVGLEMGGGALWRELIRG